MEELALASADWREGLGGSETPSQWKRRGASSLGRPVRASPENAATMNVYRTGFAGPPFESRQETQRTDNEALRPAPLGARTEN